MEDREQTIKDYMDRAATLERVAAEKRREAEDYLDRAAKARRKAEDLRSGVEFHRVAGLFS